MPTSDNFGSTSFATQITYPEKVKFMDLTVEEVTELKRLSESHPILRKFLHRLEQNIELEIVPGFSLHQDDK